jgi:pilus assembly protein Flp/PilA
VAAISTIPGSHLHREGGSALFAHAMSWMLTVAAGLRRRDEGATMVEYGLMVALIAVVALLAVAAIGTNLFGLFSDVATEIGG